MASNPYSNRPQDSSPLTETTIEFFQQQIRRSFEDREAWLDLLRRSASSSLPVPLALAQAMADLPRPDIQVTQQTDSADNTTQIDVVISRDNKAKSFTGKGTPTEAIREVVRQIIDQPATREWLP